MPILCGFLIGMIYKTTLSYQSPLYGRRSGELLLKLLDFRGFQELFLTDNFKNLLKIYSITGGIARYIEDIDERLPIEKTFTIICLPISKMASKERVHILPIQKGLSDLFLRSENITKSHFIFFAYFLYLFHIQL